MFKSLYIIVLCQLSCLSWAEANFTASSPQLHGSMFKSSSDDLCSVAQSTSNYLALGEAYDKHAIHSGQLTSPPISLQQVQKTLQFICQTQQQDQQAQRASRLHDIDFIKQHFQMIRWLPDLQQTQQYQQQKSLLKHLPDDHILLTKYYIKKATANLSPSTLTPYALYALPYDEQSLSIEQANLKNSELTRFKYSKQEVLKGALDHKENKAGLAPALIFLSREDLEDSLMQGTVVAEVTQTDGSKKTRTFNVHRNNGYHYDRSRKKELQDRYWYFKETSSIMGYGKDANHKIAIKPEVTVAGDLALFGLGKLFLLSSQEKRQAPQHRLVILADTGGAFEENGYQLDLLSGFYKNWQDYHHHWSHFPDYAKVHLLILKSSLLNNKP